MLENQFSEIILLIKYSRANAIKSVNTELINLYWNVGAFITKQLANSNWGEKTVDELADFIQKNHPELKGFNRRGLYRMKQFYEAYSTTELITQNVTKEPLNVIYYDKESSILSSPETQFKFLDKTKNKIVPSVRTQLQVAENKEDKIVPSVRAQLEIIDIRNSILVSLSWTHHRTIFSRCKTEEEREFYIRLCIQENFSVKELERQINSSSFERTMIGNSKISPSLRKSHPDITNNFKDSYVFEFLNLPDKHSESDLQSSLIAQMKDVILELGKDFLFIGEEYKLQVGNTDFYIDLLFYHRELQCLVAFELKSDNFKPSHLGQLNFYLEALDRDVKKQNENPSIGILLCKDKDSEVVEYSLSRSLSPTLVSEYKTLLPDKKLLQQKLREIFENNIETD